MKIGIVPSIKNFYRKDNNYVLDQRWLIFLKKIFKTCEVHIITQNIKNFNFNLVILSGGNDSLKYSSKKRDIIRNKIDDLVIKLCLKKKIKLIGICWGAIKINEYLNGNTKRIKNHVNTFHNISGVLKIGNKNINKKYKVNSFHNFSLKTLGNDLQAVLKCSNDNSIEMFTHKYKKIIGIMWHPERNNKINELDKIIFRSL